ncbi:SEC-C domain-containing protein [Flavobacterium sp. CGRL2]
MGELQRNDICHCGSGKKYKYCHLNKKEDVARPAKESKHIDFAELLQQKNPLQILGLLAVLQLEPENHGKNFRFEQMARKILLQVKENDSRPIATWGTLQEAIENHTEGVENENAPNCAFTENAIFEEGNYTVYPGIHDGFTGVLNELTECIFLQRNELDKEFIKQIRDAVGLLLFMSQNVATDAGHIPFQYEKSTHKNIRLSQHDKASELIQALYFSKDYISKICELHQYDKATIDAFILKPASSELNDDNPDNNVVNIKPLIEVDDSFLLYMPTSIVHSLVQFIFASAKKHDCYEEVESLLHTRQFDITCRNLSVTGWLETDITLPQTNIAIREAVFQFDNQKLAYVCYIERAAASNANSLEQRAQEVVAYLKSLNTNQNFDIFCLYVTAEASEEFSFLPVQSQLDYQCLAIRYRELNTILTDKDTNVLSLWKFAKCYNWTSAQFEIFTLGGILDIYAIYKANNYSLLDSDNINPFGGLMTILNGGAADFAMDVQKQQNLHAVRIFATGQIGYAKVSRYREYAPIYIEREVSTNFRIVIEGFKMPIWITNTQTRAYEESWATDTCEAVAFWLYKMHNLLAPYLAELNLVQFEIEIVADSRIANGQDFEVKVVDSGSIKLTHEIVPPVLKIGIPLNSCIA